MSIPKMNCTNDGYFMNITMNFSAETVILKAQGTLSGTIYFDKIFL